MISIKVEKQSKDLILSENTTTFIFVVAIITLLLLLAIGIKLSYQKVRISITGSTRLFFLHYFLNSKKRKTLFPEFKRMLEGNVKDINPELLMDEQCDSMPYDKRWEFPRYRLKLGWFNRIYSFAYDVTSMFFLLHLFRNSTGSWMFRSSRQS